MSFILTILLFALFLSHLKLKERFDELEERIKFSKSVSPVKPINEEDEVSVSAESGETKIIPDIPPRPLYPEMVSEYQSMKVSSDQEVDYTPKMIPVEAEPKDFFLVSWFKEHTLIKIGSIILFLGATYLVRYAIISDLIPPSVIILFGLLLAVASYAIAVYRSAISVEQYIVLTALGTGIVSASLFTAQIILPSFTPAASLFLLVASLLYTAYVAWQTNTKWLALATGFAGLIVPLMVQASAEPIWLLLYLLALIVGLLVVAFKMELRPVTLLLVIGVSFYELALYEQTDPNLLWFFVVLFSLAFFIGVTMSFIKTREARTIDIVSLAIAGLMFVVFASKIALSAGLATFIATILLSVAAYLFTVNNFPNRITSVYVSFAGIGLLMATSFTFSGYTEALAFVVEVTGVFMIATYLGLPISVIRLLAFGYIVPVVASIVHFSGQSWDEGIWHADAVVVYAMMISLLGTALWLNHKESIRVYNWSRPLATIFGAVGFIYAMIVVLRVTSASFSGDAVLVMAYVIWSLMSVSAIFYAIRFTLPVTVLNFSAFTLIVPLLASLDSLSSYIWHEGINHIHTFGVGTIVFVLILSILLFAQAYYCNYDQTVRRSLGAMIVVTVGYVFYALGMIFDGLLDYKLAVVASYTSYMIILYGLISAFSHLRVNIKWLGVSLLALIWPLLISIQSFDFDGWSKSEAIDAVGLFAAITILSFIAIGVRHYYKPHNDEEKIKILNWTKIILITSGVYAVGYFWSLSHSFLSAEKAVSFSLFVYTVVGLFLYQYGNTKSNSDIHKAGVALLAFVVLRLVMVDVWEMELVWRVVTFIGIGVLFIGTALLEKGEKNDEHSNQNLESKNQ